VDKTPSLNAEIIDGHLVDVPARGDAPLTLPYNNVAPFTVRLNNVLHVPGPTQRAFYGSQFAQNGNTKSLADRSVTCPLTSATGPACKEGNLSPKMTADIKLATFDQSH
jgi:hypothetical protein